MKKLNAQTGPIDTLNQPSIAGSSSDAPPAKRPRLDSSTSPYFSQPGHGDGPFSDNSSSHDRFKSKISVGLRSPISKTSLMPPKFKSSVSKKRLRRSRSGKETSYGSLSPGSDGRESAGGSPDILASEPPRVKIVSDPSPTKAYKSQRPARPAEQALAPESEDELANSRPKEKRQTNFSKFVDKPRQAASRGDIPPTGFKKPRPTLPPKPAAIGVRRAVCNSHFCERGQGQPPVRLLCHQRREKYEPQSVFKLEDCEQKGLEWLQIDIEKIKNLEKSDRRLIITRPIGKMFVELDTVQDCETFVSLIPRDKIKETGHEDVDNTFERTLKRVKNYTQGRLQASEPTQPCETKNHEKTPWSLATFVPHKGRRLIDRLQSDAPQTTEKKAIAQRGKLEVIRPANTTMAQRGKLEVIRPANTAMAQCGKLEAIRPANTATGSRQTRNSRSAGINSPPSATVVSPKLERWTRQNPTWRERWERSLTYPATGKNRTTVDDEDIPRLDEGEFINDNLISFYLRHLEIKLEDEQPGLRKRVYIFSTFFFEKLRSTRGKINYDGVKAWTAKFDLFSYDYIIVPVNEHAHWYLAIICNVPYTLSGIPAEDDVEVVEVLEEPVDSPVASTCMMTAAAKPSNGAGQKSNLRQPKIITLDSLGSQHSSTIKALKEYLVEEAKDKKNAELALLPNGMKAKDAPMQDNFCDCGLFVLGYVEEFLKDPDGNTRKMLQKEVLGWEMKPRKLRARIRELLFDLQKEQKDRLIREKAQKQKSSPSRRATQGKEQVATNSTVASTSVDVDTSSNTDKGTGPAVQQAPSKSIQKTGSESVSCVVHDDRPTVESKLKYIEELSDSDNSTSTEQEDIHHSARTSPGGRPQKGEASKSEDSTVGTEAVQGKKRSTPTGLISTLSSSSPTTVRGDDASRLLPSVETATILTSSPGKDEGSEVTPSGLEVPAQQLCPTAASLVLGSRATYGGIDRSLDLT
ncbi:hypothetical protein L249_6225 [Ophiocordyceps polyrhachis-furcata BCC 54312]|uniref:Ubiquitin-like protease family profile domain-containing protein n=1 Tax=Ophiocordyceps polyrhachis-furcata BCC 54312 TaxID=1330021 RepID=A0A367L165_9HYPO|nr:hypothetical protein L249_6225 [Ophiocordyceps polyrhachis-furcata BCC 54312]